MKQPQPTLFRWPDLSAYGARLVIAVLPDQQRLLILLGGDKIPEAAGKLGFRRLDVTGHWARDDLKINIGEFRRELPRLRVIEMAAKDILRETRLRTAPPADGQLPAEAALMQARYLGLNFEGGEVWEGVNGRFVRASGAITREAEERSASPALFLRATDPNSFLLCADGFTNEIVAGKNLHMQDLVRFASAIHGEPVDITDERLRQAQDAVEAAMVRRLAQAEGSVSRAAFELGLRLYEGQPVFKARTSSSVSLQQYSTPLPMSVVAQRLLGTPEELRGRTVLEPTVGNGSLVSLLPECQVAGFDLDADRVLRTIHLLTQANPDRRGHFSLQVGDAAAARYPDCDFSIVNPPFGGLQPPTVMHGLRVTRLDHLILMKALEARAPEGRTVAIIGGDSPARHDPGVVAGGSRYLFNWLADHYHVEGVVEMDGGMYSRQGSSYPVRMLVIGPRRESPAFGLGPEVIPDRLPVVRDFEALWEWSSQVLSSRPELQVADTGTPAPAIEATSTAVEAGDPAPVRPKRPARQDKPKADHEENTWQAPYVPVSRVGEATAMIPRNLVAPTRTALARIVAEHGDVDAWVADELGWSMDQLADRLSPEQVDAAALSFHAADRGRGAIIADQTGLGKGRILAAFAVRAHRQGAPIIFATEKANLFSDFWRDLQAIGSEDLFRPMILNAGVPVRDTVTGQVLVSATAAPVLKAALEAGETVPGTNLAFCTYSQFNRAGAKKEWLARSAGRACIILDESHNAAGESNTAEAMAAAVLDADHVIYSSATYAKNAQNLAAYSKAFPPGMNLADLPETIRAGGEALQEILSGMLAEDGVLVRREHDLSTVEFVSVLDEARLERNRQLCDALSPILTTMAYLGGDIQKLVANINADNRRQIEKLPDEDRKGARLQVSSMEFGSRLYNLNRLFVLALKTDLAQEQAKARLQRGEKPVLFVENTMESLLKDILEDSRLDMDDPDTAPEQLGVSVDLQFRDLLQRTLHRMMTITERNGYGMVQRRSISDPASLEAFARCSEMIAQFPDLSISPLDSTREALEADGYRCEELSGRSLQVVNGRIGVRPSEDRNSTISRFNGGASDAMMISGAGSTGLSLHAGAKFPDQRRRALVELQIANNVAQRVQTWGRVNRKDQVVTPAIITLNTGLPAEARLMAMQNAKLRKLSANVTSNRSNAAEDETIPDILNWVGDLVCRRMLEARPELADRLMISLPSAQDANSQPDIDDLYYVNKVLGRLTLLTSTEQEELYQEIVSEFHAVMDDFEARGTNPFKARELDGTWEVVTRVLFEGAEGAAKHSTFSAPIYCTTLSGERLITPLRTADLERQAQAGRDRLSESLGLPADQALWQLAHTVMTRTRLILESALSKEFETVEQALAATQPNGVKQRAEYLDNLVHTLENLRIGGGVSVTDEEGEAKKGFILRLDTPPAGKEHLAGQYTVTFALPGDERPRRMTLYALTKDPAFALHPDGIEMQPFDDAPEGKVRVMRTMLDGNLFGATQFAQHIKSVDGRRLGNLVVWRDADGVANRGLLLPKSVLSVELLPVQMNPIQAAALLREVGKSRVYTSSSLDDTGIIIAIDRGKMTLSAPGIGGSSAVFAHSDVTAVTGDWAGDRDRMFVAVPLTRGEEALQALASVGCRFYAEGTHRNWANAWSAREMEDGLENAPQRASRRAP